MSLPNIKNSGAATASNTAVPGTGVTVTCPSGASAPASNDLIVYYVGNDDNTTTAQWNNTTLKPSGFTMINETGNSSSDVHTAVFWKLSDGTEGGTGIASNAQSSMDTWGRIEIWENIDTTTPIDVTGSDYNGSSASSHAVTGVTTTIDDCIARAILAGDGGDTYPFTVSGTGWTEDFEIQAGTGSGNCSGCIATKTMSTAGATGNCTFSLNVSDGGSGFQFGIRGLQAGINSVTPSTFDMDESSITVSGEAFGATQGTGTVYISDADTLAGSINEVEIANGINTWSDTSINLDLTGLNSTEETNLNTLGPGTRYVIVVTNGSAEYGSGAVTLHRAEAFVLSASANIIASGENTTVQLTAPATKSTADFDAGRIQDDENPADTIDITLDDYTELEWCFKVVDAARDVAYQFRVTSNGTALTTYTVTPQLIVSAGTNVNCTTDALLLVEHDAIVNAANNIQANVDSLSMTTYSATISLHIDVAANTDALTLTEYAATVNAAKNISANTDALTLTTYQANINAATNILATTANLTLSENAAVISLHKNITCNTDALTLTTYQANVSGANPNNEILANVANLTLTEYPATVNAALNITTNVDALTLTTYSADIALDLDVQAGVDSLVLTVYPSSIKLNRNVQAKNQDLILTTYQATINAANNITTTTDALVLTTYTATITSGAQPEASGAHFYAGEQMIIRRDETAAPLWIAIDNTGGVSGLTVIVQIRDGNTTNSYLDFNDDTFKTSGWTQKSLTLTDLGSGYYHNTLDISSITNLPSGNHLSLEYDISGDVTGVSNSTLTLDDTTSLVWDEVLEGTMTAEEMMRIMAAVLCGKASGLDVNSPVFRSIMDTKPRVTSTTDDHGNRSSVTMDGS